MPDDSFGYCPFLGGGSVVIDSVCQIFCVGFALSPCFVVQYCKYRFLSLGKRQLFTLLTLPFDVTRLLVLCVFSSHCRN